MGWVNILSFQGQLSNFKVTQATKLSETGQICGFFAISGEHFGEMVWNFTCRCMLTTFRTDYILVCGFSSFWQHFGWTDWNRSKLQFWGTFWITHGRNSLKFDMLMYVHHLHFGHSLLIFLIWTAFWLSQTCQNCVFQAFYAEGMGGIAWQLMYPHHLQNSLGFGHGLLIFSILVAFWLSKTGKIWGLWAFSWECMRGMALNLVMMYLHNWLNFGDGLLIFLIFVMFALWHHAYLTGLWLLDP